MKLFYLIRILLKKLWLKLGFLVIEYCDRCGIQMPVVWWCEPNELWAEVTGYEAEEGSYAGGCYCPVCFDILANEKGIAIRFFAQEDYRFRLNKNNQEVIL